MSQVTTEEIARILADIERSARGVPLGFLVGPAGVAIIGAAAAKIRKLATIETLIRDVPNRCTCPDACPRHRAALASAVLDAAFKEPSE